MSDTEPTSGKSDRRQLGSLGLLIVVLVVVGIVLIVAWFGIYGQKAGREYEDQEAAEVAARVTRVTDATQAALQLATADESVERKIIKTGNLELHVADLDASAEQIRKLVKDAGGFVASQSFFAQPGSWPRCNLTLRVPSGEFDRVMAELRKHGEVRHLRIGTQDVTEEFIDLEARLRNLEREEGVLLDLFERRTTKLTDVLEVERELSRVRGDIETTQGRLRYLKHKVSLSTIEVQLTEIGEAAIGPTGRWQVPFHVRSAGRVLVTVARAAFTAIIYIAIVGAPVWVVVGIWLGVRRRRRQ